MTDPRELLLGQLAYYRATVLTKLDGLSDEDLRTSRLPSGWSPLELLKHLVFVERRWMQYGFEAEDVPQPFGDDDPDTKRWFVTEDDDVAGLAAWWDEIATRTETVVRASDLTERGRLGGRFTTEAPTLGWILAHLVQESARHVGQLDIVRELIDGETGE
jgi:uncharacterized damage-inducible protein DinB